MKKGYEWLIYLKPKELKRFHKTLLKIEKKKPGNFIYLMNEDIISFERFILRAFVWSETPEGHKYWEKISKRKTN